MIKYIDPFSDVGFKAIFGKEGQSEEILKEFLNEVFRDQPFFDEIREVQFINNERVKETSDDKTIVHDIMCVTDSGQRFIVEMQKSKHDNFLMRAIYYVSRGVTDQAIKNAGEPMWEYDFLPIAGVYVTTHSIKGLPNKLLTHAALTDLSTGNVIGNHIRFAFIQTNLFNKSEHECLTKFDKLIYTLKNMPTLLAIPFKEYERDIFSRMEKAAEYAALSPEERRDYDAYLKYERDRASELNTARREAIAEGRAEGRAESLRELVLKMKKEGEEVSKIILYTGLNEQEIASIN